ncbi:L-dopachrome tautomerase-related protein [Streptomyces sp. SBT349]|uniref:L-dopachrome tautomerase-related protein n=1 Tax=Streptomyces sp. SBT349 TaxID=1580539 RepID=UPI00066C8B2D|nr:L-dopachrome tautomerase-related protein [Streptomyces sp. SBT349]
MSGAETDGKRTVPLGSWVATDFEVVAEFHDNMPTGLTVTDEGRIFVSFPRWGDEVPFTVAEVVDGSPVAYPDAEVNAWSEERAGSSLVSVQSVITDPVGHVWILDSGSPSFSPWVEGGPKLVEVDPASDTIVRTVPISPEAMTRTTYLNDVRFDFSRGRAGFAYITDSQPRGALIVVDLHDGRSWARLRGHPTTSADDRFQAIVQGVVHDNYAVGVDGIAISASGDTIHYCCLAGRRLHSVDADALTDPSGDEEDVAATVADLGDKCASDGLESDTEGYLYATAYEHSAVIRRAPDGTWSTVMHGPELLWPDTLAVAADGHLYLSVNQLPRAPLFNDGDDTRVPPYRVIRKHLGCRPVRLRGSH